jgi:hypothetical protein
MLRRNRIQETEKIIRQKREDFNGRITVMRGCPVSHLVEPMRYNVEGRRFDSRWCHYGSGVDSVGNRNEYQEYLLGGKGGLATFMCRLSRNENEREQTDINMHVCRYIFKELTAYLSDILKNP